MRLVNGLLIDKGHVKELTLSKKRGSGRDFFGHISLRGRGGGTKRRTLVVDFYRRLFWLPAIVRRVEKDVKRSGFVFLIAYENGSLSYVLGTDGIGIGSFLVSVLSFNIKYLNYGMQLPLKILPVGSLVHSVSFLPNGKGKIARAAGTFCQILRFFVKDSKNYVVLRLPSKEERMFDENCFCVYGIVSNPEHKNEKLTKAGENRWRGFVPLTRGVAKNPVDHPMGGGEGRSSGGRPSVSQWGILTKGYPTKRGQRRNNRFILITKRKVRQEERNS